MFLYLVPLMLLLSSCGNGNDTVLTGFSGVLIFGIIVYVIFRMINRRQ
jgi:hypothetical protein